MFSQLCALALLCSVHLQQKSKPLTWNNVLFSHLRNNLSNILNKIGNGILGLREVTSPVIFLDSMIIWTTFDFLRKHNSFERGVNEDINLGKVHLGICTVHFQFLLLILKVTV